MKPCKHIYANNDGGSWCDKRGRDVEPKECKKCMKRKKRNERSINAY